MPSARIRSLVCLARLGNSSSQMGCTWACCNLGEFAKTTKWRMTDGSDAVRSATGNKNADWKPFANANPESRWQVSLLFADSRFHEIVSIELACESQIDSSCVSDGEL